jgi:hypothetical protein
VSFAVFQAPIAATALANAAIALSVSSQGTLFKIATLFVPTSQDSAEIFAPSMALTSIRRNSCRVLIVDKSPVAASSIY